LPWYILCARRNPDFFRIFIIEHNFKRYLTPEFQHIQPFWYYGPVLLIELLPWAAIAAGAFLGQCLDKSRFQIDTKTHFLLSWALFCIVFFSASKSKLPGYVLPALPAVVFLVAVAISSSKRILSQGSIAGAMTAGVVFSAIGLLPIAVASRRNSFIVLPVVGAFFGALGIANLFVALALRRRTSSNLLTILQLLAITPILLLFSEVRNAVNHHWFWAKSPRNVASLLIREDIPVKHLSTFHLRRDTQFALSFYLHSEINAWESNKMVDGFVLTDGRSCKQLNVPLNCREVWDRRDLGDSIWSLLRITPANSPDGTSGRGQMH
jgi:4-amino-4-deoxy-L-arabinose transferase-like glycosyltransferase